ncbi:hypothetical protein B0T19DRAFT_402625 [Cercophora scortea]|uniref:Uncharacterized protein n=1 Tax=Cercophora scortea TaxID=314031 RepID=A0AAE0IGC6_9PEZI|nr:hypothetical protein B0T19DRAFT_402625 [Cercophora scortea]
MCKQSWYRYACCVNNYHAFGPDDGLTIMLVIQLCPVAETSRSQSPDGPVTISRVLQARVRRAGEQYKRSYEDEKRRVLGQWKDRLEHLNTHVLTWGNVSEPRIHDLYIPGLDYEFHMRKYQNYLMIPVSDAIREYGRIELAMRFQRRVTELWAAPVNTANVGNLNGANGTNGAAQNGAPPNGPNVQNRGRPRIANAPNGGPTNTPTSNLQDSSSSRSSSMSSRSSGPHVRRPDAYAVRPLPTTGSSMNAISAPSSGSSSQDSSPVPRPQNRTGLLPNGQGANNPTATNSRNGNASTNGNGGPSQRPNGVGLRPNVQNGGPSRNGQNGGPPRNGQNGGYRDANQRC